MQKFLGLSVLATSLLIVSCNHAEKLSEKDFDNRITFGWVEGNCIVSQKDAATHKRDMALIFDENKNILQRIDRADDPAWKTCPVLIRAQNNGEPLDHLYYDVPDTYESQTTIVALAAHDDLKALDGVAEYLEQFDMQNCSSAESIIYSVIRKSDGQVIWQDVNRLGYDVPQTCSDDLQILD